MLSRSAVVFAMLLVWAGGAGAAALTPEPALTGQGAPRWAGSQFVQADRAGRVSVLRGDTLTVYPLTKGGTFGEPVKLQQTPGSESEMPLRAALSPMGDRWLVYSPFSVRLFVDGEEKSLPD